MMKSLSFLIVLITLSFNLGGNGNSNLTTNEVSQNDNTISGVDYQPLQNNASFSGHLVGTVNYYDSLGPLTRTDQIDRDCQAELGFVQSLFEFNVHAIRGFDFDGKLSNHGFASAYLGVADR